MSMYELVEEQTISQPQTKKVANDHKNVDCIVLLVDKIGRDEQTGEAQVGYNADILGASMYEWVARSCPTKPITIRYNPNQELVSLLRPMLKDNEYTLVLYSDTPLLTATGVNEILDYVANHNLSVCKLARGWVFKTDYIKLATAIYATTTYDVAKSQLTIVSSVSDYVNAKEILQKRVMDYHINAGVDIVDPKNTYIGCNVSISSGATIEPFCYLIGKTNIGASKICSFTKLEDTLVGDRTIIKNYCYLQNAIIKDGCLVGDKTTIVGKSVVADECIIGADSHLANCLANEGCTIGCRCTLVNTKLAAKASVNEAAQCLGSDVADVKIGNGTTVAPNCIVAAGAYIRAGVMTQRGQMVLPKDEPLV